MQTPWGRSQTQRAIAVGIVSYSTAGHGGIHLSAARDAVVRQLWPDFQPFTAPGWYEEDCDWAIVALAFPDCFSDAELRGAVNTIDHLSYAKTIAAWYLSPAPQAAAIRARVAAFSASIADKLSLDCLRQHGEASRRTGAALPGRQD